MTKLADQWLQHTQQQERSIPLNLACGIYEESRWIARVRIVSDRSDDVFERCTLRVIEHLRHDSSMNTPGVGELFEYLWRRGVMCAGVGRLTRD
jgi:hypothetical protein